MALGRFKGKMILISISYRTIAIIAYSVSTALVEAKK